MAIRFRVFKHSNWKADKIYYPKHSKVFHNNYHQATVTGAYQYFGHLAASQHNCKGAFVDQ